MERVQHIVGGHIVTPEGIVENGTVRIENGRIAEILPFPKRLPHPADDMDASGLWVLPGMIDTHSDAIEHEMQPRPTSRFPVELSFYELERKLAAQGITMIYHSLSMWGDNAANESRRNASVSECVDRIGELRKEKRLIHHRIHIRYEITNREAVPYLERFLGAGVIDQLSFMDHTPGQGQYRNLEVQKKFIMERQKKTEQEVLDLLAERRSRPKTEAAILKRLADLAYQSGVPLASHDDDSIEKLDLVRDWRAAISEFPVTMEVAAEAKRRGFHVVMGAPNVMLGRSHSNNLSAREAIDAGLVDMLCSDYYPPAMLQAVFSLHRQGMGLPEAVNMVSLGPAKALGIDRHYGSIAPGKAADLLLVRTEEGRPVIETVLVGGHPVCRMAYRHAETAWDGKGAERVEV